MTIRIRAALPGERNELEDLQRRASLAVEKYREDLLAHPEAIHLPLSQILENRVRAAEAAGRIVGFSVILPKSAQIFDLDGLFVEPTLWRSGVGRKLIADAVQCVEAQGGSALEVVANPTAEIFYEKNGFERFGCAETQFGPAHTMRRVLRP